MNNFVEAVKEQFEVRGGTDEFGKLIYSLRSQKHSQQFIKYNFISAYFEKKRILHDKEVCRKLLENEGLTIPVMASLTSKEVMRNIICAMIK